VPKEALLDRFGQVNEKGEYFSEIKKGTRFAHTLVGLSGGRI
jgi:hypothetical protein